MKADLPKITMEKLLKKAGAKRVSENAKAELEKILKRKTDAVSKKAILFADHAGRKTVKREDVLLAIEE